MTIAEQLQQIAINEQRVYEAGRQAGINESNKTYGLLYEEEITKADTAQVKITADKDGNPLDLKAFYLFIEFPQSTEDKVLDGRIVFTDGQYTLYLLNTFTNKAVSASATQYWFANGRLENGMWTDVWKSVQTKNNRDANVTKVFFNHSNMVTYKNCSILKEIQLDFYKKDATPPNFDIGTKIKLYGVRR